MSYYLVDDSLPWLSEKTIKEIHGEFNNTTEEGHRSDKKEFILTSLVVDLSDDVEFLKKVNKITFGLISKQ
jgi:hypothetical protein